jgi:hypothetical protein
VDLGRRKLSPLEGVLVVALLTSTPSGSAERRRLRRLALTRVGLLVFSPTDALR